MLRFSIAYNFPLEKFYRNETNERNFHLSTSLIQYWHLNNPLWFFTLLCSPKVIVVLLSLHFTSASLKLEWQPSSVPAIQSHTHLTFSLFCTPSVSPCAQVRKEVLELSPKTVFHASQHLPCFLFTYFVPGTTSLSYDKSLGRGNILIP